MGDGNKAKNPIIAEENPKDTLLSFSLTHLKIRIIHVNFMKILINIKIKKTDLTAIKKNVTLLIAPNILVRHLTNINK